MNETRNKGQEISLYTFSDCPWTLKDVIISFFYAVALFYVFYFWLAAIYALINFLGKNPYKFKLFLHSLKGLKNYLRLFIFYGSLFISMKIKIFKKYRIAEFDFFIKKGQIKDDIIYGVKSYFKFLAVLLGIVIFVFCAASLWDMLFKGNILEKVNVYFIASNLEKVAVKERIAGLASIITLFAVAPFFEELFFRGCLFRALRKTFKRPLSIAISSFFFTLLHGYFFLFFYVFWIGWLLASMYEKRQSLVAPFSFHVANNIVVGLLFLLGC